MIELWENILERPKWQKIMMWAGAFTVLSYIFWSFMIGDLFTEMESKLEKVESLDAQVAVETGKLKALPTIKRDLSLYNELHGRALEMLPSKGQVEGLLDTVSSLARDAGLTVKVFTPKTEVKKQFFAEIPVDVDMRGNFQQVQIFLDELSRASRIVTVQDILLSNPRGFQEGGLVEVDVKAVLKTFRYLEPSERAKVQEESSVKGKKPTKK